MDGQLLGKILHDLIQRIVDRMEVIEGRLEAVEDHPALSIPAIPRRPEEDPGLPDAMVAHAPDGDVVAFSSRDVERWRRIEEGLRSVQTTAFLANGRPADGAWVIPARTMQRVLEALKP